MIVAPHFGIDELLASRDHPELAARPIDLPAEHLLNLSRLTWSVLVPLRDRFGPVIVTSGYRPRALNEQVNGAGDSRHLTGCAVDFTFGRHAAEAAWSVILAGGVKPTWDRICYYGERFHVDQDEHGNEGRGLAYVNEPGGWVKA